MFDRIKYKKFARVQLSGRWTVPVLMTLVCGIISMLTGGFRYGGAAERIMEGAQKHPLETFIGLGLDVGRAAHWESMFLPMYIIEILVGSVMCMAQTHVYLKMSRSPEPVHFGDFVEGLGLWLRGILAGAWTALWIAIWSVLFVIPGIIKAFAYSQIFFLAAEYPSLSIRKAMSVSMEITRGHKGDLFIMYASFAGWILLAAATFGIGLLWVAPYMQMTAANAYHGLLKEAVASGRIQKEDLAG